AEVQQLVRKKLFVRDGATAPKIREYRGTGSLSGWVRIVAIRTARDLQRSHKMHAPVEEAGASQIRSALPDPELQYLKKRYGREFRQAFQTVLSTLPERERNVMRLHFLEGMTSAAIGALYQVQGATIRLW